MRGGGDEGYDFAETLVFVVEGAVKTLFLQREDGLVEAVFEFGLDGAFLLGQGVAETVVGDGFPVVETVDLGGC